jgi:hypothetical protein
MGEALSRFSNPTTPIVGRNYAPRERLSTREVNVPSEAQSPPAS